VKEQWKFFVDWEWSWEVKHNVETLLGENVEINVNNWELKLCLDFLYLLQLTQEAWQLVSSEKDRF